MVGAEQAEGEHDGGEQEQAAELAAALVLPGVLLRWLLGLL